MEGIKQLREQADPYKTSLDLLKSIIKKTTQIAIFSKDWGIQRLLFKERDQKCHDVEHKSILI